MAKDTKTKTYALLRTDKKPTEKKICAVIDFQE